VRHRKKAVIIYRLAALGDVICTLPLCGEIRKRHPGRLLIFITAADYRKIVSLSRAADCVYGAVWKYGVRNLPGARHFGLVEQIYIPRTTDERFQNTGVQSHLVDDLAASCGVVIPVSNRQPRLFPSSEMIQRTRAKYGLAEDTAGTRRTIGVHIGRTWPVRMWDNAKWQKLVDGIHAEFDAVILQFGRTNGGGADPLDRLTGVQPLVNRVKPDELAALLASCQLLISVDSGPVHLAGAVGTPVVGLFGAVNPRFRLPPDSSISGLFSDVPCLFCHHTTPCGHWQTGCPNEMRCMRELEVQPVFQAVKSVLSNNKIGVF